MRTMSMSLAAGAVPIAAPGRDPAALVRRFLHALARRQARRRNLLQLYALDDGTLKDIGLHRTELSSVVHEGVRRRRVNADA